MKRPTLLFALVSIAGCSGPAAVGADATATDDAGSDAAATDDAGSDAGPAVCVLGRCPATCAEAAALHTWLGCEFWPVATLDTGLANDLGTGTPMRQPFHFALTVSNPGPENAEVMVTLGTTAAALRTVAAGSATTILLEWNEALQPLPDPSTHLSASSLVRGAAYHVTSDHPVAVAQFNPLEAAIPGTGTTTSAFTADASLLLPTHGLGTDYVAISRPTQLLHRTSAGTPSTGPLDDTSSASGFVTLVATETTTVEVTFSAHVLASRDGVVHAFAPGDHGAFSLVAGDVLQLATDRPPTCTATGTDHQTQMDPLGTSFDVTIEYCATGDDYDLTGTLVHASGPIEVIGGHDCAFVPANRWACDHLEESIPPTVTWGTETLIGITQPLHSEPNVLRIVSGADGNTIHVEPSSLLADTTLARGEYVELEASSAFRVTGTGPLQVASFLVGQDYAGFGSSGGTGTGDPSMSLVTPTAQMRTAYVVAIPPGYTSQLLVTTTPGVSVHLAGGSPIGLATVGTVSSGSTAVGEGYQLVAGNGPFALTVYGAASYSSFMLTGGQDLRPLR